MKTSLVKKIKVGCVQESFTESKDENIEKILSKIEELASKNVELILLPELHASLYFCQTENVDQFSLAESIPGPTTTKLSAAALKHQVVIVASIFERRAPGIYHNTAVVFEKDGSIAGIYRKMHIPDDPGFYEKFYFTPGDLGFKPIKTSVGCLGVLVCWDQWFPEAARLMALSGADILLYPTAIGWDMHEKNEEENLRQREAWELIQRSHAIANGLPVVACNRVGLEMSENSKDGVQFWGASFVSGQQGEILEKAPVDGAYLLICDVDFSKTEAVRCIWPYLRDRRIDAYDGLLKRYIDEKNH
jgi:N-carbamoylputrescine amidase